jgi:glutamyl endopeptidase
MQTQDFAVSRYANDSAKLALTAFVALTLLAAPRPASAQEADAQAIAAQPGTRIPASRPILPPNGGSNGQVNPPGITPRLFKHSVGQYKPWAKDVEVGVEMASGRSYTAPARERTPMESAAAGQLFDDGTPGYTGAGPYTERFPELAAQAARAAYPPMSPPMEAPGDGSPRMREQKVFGADNRVRITPTNYFPARAQCRLVMTYKDNSVFVGSGTMVGYKYVLTAGHVVYNHDHGGWAKSIAVYPGQDGGSIPYSAYATKLRSVTGWTSSEDSDYDYALITLNKNLGNSTGWFGLASFSDSTLDSTGTAYITGYPAEKAWGTQWQHWGPLTDNDSTMVYYRIDTTGGQSGSGVYRFYNNSRYVFAVHTGWSWHFDWFSSGEYNHGTRITSSRYYLIQGWMASGY